MFNSPTSWELASQFYQHDNWKWFDEEALSYVAVFFQDSFDSYLDWNAILGLFGLQTQQAQGRWFKSPYVWQTFQFRADCNVVGNSQPLMVTSSPGHSATATKNVADKAEFHLGLIEAVLSSLRLKFSFPLALQ